MESEDVKPEDMWKRFRVEKSLEELAAEQGYKPPEKGWPGLEGFMDDDEWEAFHASLQENRSGYCPRCAERDRIQSASPVVSIEEDPAAVTQPVIRRFPRSKTVEQLVMEQGTKIPDSFEGYLASILPDDQTIEAWNARIERWRAEDGERGAS